MIYIIYAILIAVVLYVFFLAVNYVVLTSLVWLIGVIAGSLVLLILYRRAAKSIRNNHTRISFESGAIRVVVDRSAVRNRTRFIKPSSIGLCLLINFVLLLVFLGGTDLNTGGAVLTVTIVSLVWIIAILRIDLAERITKRVHHQNNHLTDSVISELERITREIDDLAEKLGCQFPLRSDTIGDDLWKTYLDDPSMYQTHNAELIQLLDQEREQLMSAVKRSNEFESHYFKAVDLILGSPSLEAVLNKLYVRYRTAVEEYIPAREWDKFFEAMGYLIDEVRTKMNNNRSGGNTGSASSKMSEQQAHLILGTEPTWSTEQINRAYREKVKRFHPDGASGPVARDDEYMKLINVAMDTIRASA